jgi:hypothetical protein
MQSGWRWPIYLTWAVIHFALAIGLVVIFVDRMDLIDQTAMPEACDRYLKFHPTAQIASEWTFAWRCWNPGSAIEFYLAALVGIAFILSPFTCAMLFARRKRRDSGLPLSRE